MKESLRSRAAELARKYGATSTAEVVLDIKQCYREIFAEALAEVGAETTFRAIVEMEEPWVAKEAMLHMPNLAETQRDTLLEIIIRIRNIYVASSILWSDKSFGLDAMQRRKLAKACRVGPCPSLSS